MTTVLENGAYENSAIGPLRGSYSLQLNNVQLRPGEPFSLSASQKLPPAERESMATRMLPLMRLRLSVAQSFTHPVAHNS